VAYNLVLRNLTGHAYIDLSLATCDSVAQCNTLAAETNCVDDNSDDRALTINSDKVASISDNTPPLSDAAQRTPSCENSDTLASGDSGVCGININSLQSPSYISDNVVDASPNSLSDVTTTCSSYHGDELTPSNGDSCTMDSTAGGDTDLRHHTVAKSHSEFSTEAAVCHVSDTSRVSSEIPIQQVVYT